MKISSVIVLGLISLSLITSCNNELSCNSYTSEASSDINQTEREDKMKITLMNQAFDIDVDKNETSNDILKRLPLELKMVRYAGHEYYATLPFTPKFDQERTSSIKAGHVYYWDGWNAFVINYVDYEIAPYKVVHIGEITNKNICELLKNAQDSISVNVDNI